MISNVNDFLISLGTSSVLVILLKVTATTTVALVGVQFARRSRAAVRHLLLLAAFAALLTLPVISVLAPSLTIAVPIRTPAPSVSMPALVTPADTTFSMPTVEPDGPATQESSHGQTLQTPSVGTILLAIWGLGAAAVLLPIVVGLWQVRSFRRAGLPWLRGRAFVGSLAPGGRLRRHVEVVLHENVPGPMTCGLLRPTIILPRDAETWATVDLERAMVHELEHVRRGDWISQCLARAACAAYWFHPLVWIAWRQLTLEAERACDDAVLQGAEATAYADQLVALAKRLSGATKTPVLAMANRHDLAARVTAVLDRRQPRGRAGTFRVAVVCVTSAIAVAIVSPLRMIAATEESSAHTGEPMTTRALGAPSSLVSAPSGTSLGQGSSKTSAAMAPVLPQEPKPLSNATPTFDVVSVRPCAPDAPSTGRGGGLPIGSPGRLHYECFPLHALMSEAYLSFAGGHSNPTWEVAAVDWAGEPQWTRSERFSIEATTADSVPLAVVRGPMLQALLEDRFKVKVHRETRRVPVYELTVAKTGAKLTPFTPGSCVPHDWSVWPPRPLGAGDQACRSSYQQDGTNIVRTFEGMPLDQIASQFGGFDRPVVNKTGISGLVGFRLVYEREASTGDKTPPPAFVRALKDQLGLELHPAMGPRDVIVVDHAERPTPNDASAIPSVDPPAPAQATAPTAAGVVTAPVQTSSPATGPLPNFEAVSVRPCDPTAPAPAGAPGAGRGGVGGLDGASPGRLNFRCATLLGLVQFPYSLYANGRVNSASEWPVLPPPSDGWISHDRWAIEAKADGEPPVPVMFGPMLQRLLEDQFKLKVHREPRVVPVYELVVAKGGSKVTPVTPGTCVAYDFSVSPPPQPTPQPGQHWCTNHNERDGNGNIVEIMEMITLQDFFGGMQGYGRPIVNKTGITGPVGFRLVMSGPDTVDPDERLSSLIAALRKDLGLELRPGKDPIDFLVIDHAEKPVLKGQAPSVEGISSARAQGPGR
jgi:uncharacterized protein (TIGR03435 family)